MKYKDLIQFEPISEVVKFARLGEQDYRKALIKNFVFSKDYENVIIPELCRNLDYTSSEDTYGLQIVGNYGTGKSHLMSLFSIIAEDADYLPLVQNEKARQVLSNIAGKYKIIRFELGSNDEFWNLVGYQIDQQFEEWGIPYSILNDNKPDMYSNKLDRMMAYFDQKFPDKGLMIVIDEMLSYLKGRSGSDQLNRDLAVLQALGQVSDHSKFSIVFGAQELIYSAPEFRFAAEMLNRVADRYRQLNITKQDVQFVVEQRLLKKNDDQKNSIRKHLEKFTEFFPDMHANLDEYVNLFPVNPSFFENFQQIKVGKSQREILKTLTTKFEEISEQDVPDKEPGLICYDSYWNDLSKPRMHVYPDILRVKEIMDTIYQKIDENFTGLRAKKIPLAKRIANACAVKILQEEVVKTNGIKAETLVDDLCFYDSSCFNREWLLDVVKTCADQIVTATVGQYFEKNNGNQEYHLRVEGGVNYEQKIKDFVATMSADNKDSHFFNFLCEYLPIDAEQYRRGFKIFPHRIDWRSHKVMLDGYIFFGNPNERSTTHPEQNFYIYYMPIFNRANLPHGNEPDSIYVHMEKISEEFKQLFELYAAADSLYNSVDSSQKPFYDQYKKKYLGQLKPIFDREFFDKSEIVYQGAVQTVHLSGPSKEQAVSDVASQLLEDYFCAKMPDYPKFSLLRASLTPANRAGMLKAARLKIANPLQQNRDGEAVLAGMGLLKDNQLSIDDSIYALSVKQKLDTKGQGQVLNRDEILHRFFESWDNDWRSNDYEIPSDLEFLALAALVALGKIEINFSGKNINATNLKEIVDMTPEQFYTFSHIRYPKDMNLSLVREILVALTGVDMTQQLDNPATYAELAKQASILASDAVMLESKIGFGISVEDIPLMDATEASSLRHRLKALAGFCDRIQQYNTKVKLSNLPKEWTEDSLKKTFETIPEIRKTRELMDFAKDFSERIRYLNQAKQYMISDEMKARVDAALAEVKSIVENMGDTAKVNAYRNRLDALIGDYADWYVAEYNRLHITNIQDSEKRTILNSNENKICEKLIRADNNHGYFPQGSQYKDWTKRISSLNAGSIARESVLRTPYMGFNPVQFQGKELPELSDLEREVKEIHSNLDDSLHTILKSPELLKNEAGLDDSEAALLRRFNSNAEPLTVENAERLFEIVVKLHRGIYPLNITAHDLRNIFNRPMMPDEMIKAFRQYVNLISKDYDPTTVRIFFKDE